MNGFASPIVNQGQVAVHEYAHEKDGCHITGSLFKKIVLLFLHTISIYFRYADFKRIGEHGCVQI